MTKQEYFEDLIEEAKIFDKKHITVREEYFKLFPETDSKEELKNRILEMNEEQLRHYFMTSQLIVDTQIIFSKIASFIHFSKMTNDDLNIEKVNEVPTLASFISSYEPFKMEYAVNSEGVVVEKNKKAIDIKFKEFEKTLKTTLNIF